MKDLLPAIALATASLVLGYVIASNQLRPLVRNSLSQAEESLSQTEECVTTLKDCTKILRQRTSQRDLCSELFHDYLEGDYAMEFLDPAIVAITGTTEPH